MISRYLTDIEQLLDEQHGDEALQEAFDLPRIAVALTDPQLRCSPERLKTWCQQWLGPADSGRETRGVDYERVGRHVSEHVTQLESAPSDSVPVRALQRLRLRRHVRTPPRGFLTPREETLEPQQNETAQVCTALVEAARRWYARSACHDLTVQTNLARLAVLR